MYKLLLKPWLFLLPPESAHAVAFGLMSAWQRIPGARGLTRLTFKAEHTSARRSVMGLDFSSPVGIAAGLDKNARYLETFAMLGAGFVEIGTVTPRPQAGNPRPRIFRLAKDQALINRMGFNNDGADAIAARLSRRPAGLIIGGNIGKNRNTPVEKAVDDYLYCLDRLAGCVDYLAINVSSPNTPGLRDLQDPQRLDQLLERLQAANRRLASPRPLLIKISPDLSDAQAMEIGEVALKQGITGIIVSNTTVGRMGLRTAAERVSKAGEGGLSGQPLLGRSTSLLASLTSRFAGRLTMIASGGVMSPADARAKMEAGADLVQLYTGIIYHGPALIRRIIKEAASQ